MSPLPAPAIPTQLYTHTDSTGFKSYLAIAELVFSILISTKLVCIPAFPLTLLGVEKELQRE